jgi:CheY-like chemotaxis protein
MVVGAPPDRGASDLDAVAAEGIEVLLRARTPRVRYVRSPRPLRVRMGAAALRRIVDNLLLNAADAVEGTPGDIVVTAAAAPGDRALLEVRDGGRGMPPGTAARVFEPGFTTRPGGRGLGLSVVRSLVERCGGEVSVSSGEGRGTAVRVLLPLAPAPAHGTGTILLVDDHADVRGSMKAVLAGSGYKVLEAGDGREALRLLDGVDLLLTDLKLPDMEGTALATAAAVARPGLKVAFMSGYAWPRDPGGELLVKPQDPDELRERIGTILGR